MEGIERMQILPSSLTSKANSAMTQDSRIPVGRKFTPLMPGLFGFEWIWGQVVERLMETLGIINGFDVAEHAESYVYLACCFNTSDTRR